MGQVCLSHRPVMAGVVVVGAGELGSSLYRLLEGGQGRLGFAPVAHLLKKSFPNEGTRSLMTKPVGIGRQAERGADGYRAVDRLRRVVGVGRAAAPEEGAAFPLPRPQALPRPASAAGDPLRSPHGDRVDAPAARARLRIRGHLLAAPGRVAAGRGMGASARALALEASVGG